MISSGDDYRVPLPMRPDAGSQPYTPMIEIQALFGIGPLAEWQRQCAAIRRINPVWPVSARINPTWSKP